MTEKFATQLAGHPDTGRPDLQRPDTGRPDTGRPRFITIEGPIGVGKTSLAKRLADTFGYQVLLENAEENPFLPRFYRNRRQAALATQLFFLFQRIQQIQDMRQSDLFSPAYISDFLLQKDRLFARINLDDDEMQLYDRVYERVAVGAPIPDLVIYLQAPVHVLSQRVYRRGISYEQSIDSEYLSSLNQAYSQYFLYYDDAPLLIVNAEQIDLVNNERDYQQFVDYLLTIKSGRHYFNPMSFA